MNYGRVTENIREGLKSYIRDNGLKSLVLGISGGIDSAVVAVLAKPVCDELGVPLIGRSITIESNSPEEIRRSHMIGKSFCTDFKEVNLTKLYHSMRDTYKSLEAPSDGGTARKIREGNLKARIRMTYLYDICQANGGITMSTDNKTEELLGFFTIHGDHFDLGIIQSLFKTEVYELASYLMGKMKSVEERQDALALEECIKATPTDGLGISSSDLEQIGVATYDEVDVILLSYLNGGAEKVGCPVIARHKRTWFKREWPITFPREKIITK